MKVIAWYLPQFHEIPENNEWWGEGFTEWTNVKKAQPLVEGHNQPRVPLDNNYYNLLEPHTKKWQVEIAKKYGIYGFCFHHYWFSGKLLLEKPAEQFLEDSSLDIHFCFNWANEHWTNQWVTNEQKVLIEQQYGGPKEWKEHFEYLLPFFKDPRYIRCDNKPLFIIYRPDYVECLNEMLDYWQNLAKENGLDGLCMSYVGYKWDYLDKDDSAFTYDIEYNPTGVWNMERQSLLSVKLYNLIPNFVKRIFTKKLTYLKGIFENKEMKNNNVRDYDDTWNKILNYPYVTSKSIPCAFVDFDNTSRKGNRGVWTKNVSTERFKYYFGLLLRKARDVYKKDMMFIFAWNEWAECGYLEPDTKNGYGFLEAIKECLDEFENE